MNDGAMNLGRNRELGARPALSYFVILIAIYLVNAFFSDAVVDVFFGYLDADVVFSEDIEFWKHNANSIVVFSLSLMFIYGILAWHFPDQYWRERFDHIGVRRVGHLPYLVAVLLALLFGALLGVFREYYLDIHYDTDSVSSSLTVNSAFGFLLLTVCMCVLVPIIEELFFRGLLYYSIRRSWGVLIATLISSVLFVGVHAVLYRLASFELVLFFFMLSFVFVVLRERYGTILPGMVLHGVYNFFVLMVV